MAQYQGVDVDHPRIVENIKKMAENGTPKEQVMKLVGMPMEVIQKHWPKKLK